jgi:hypothetical protein
MSEITTPLTRDEQLRLKKAAFGAVQLLSLAYPGALSTTRENMVGAKVLVGATGVVGQILASKDKVPIKGTTAEVAAVVLPALRSTVVTLETKAPDETQEFRRVVTAAVKQAAEATEQGPRPVHIDMISKITDALNAR